MGTKVEAQNEFNPSYSKLENKKAKALKWLDENFGKHKRKRILTKKDIENLALNHTEKEAKVITKKYNFTPILQEER
jgi:hypothetical protein